MLVLRCIAVTALIASVLPTSLDASELVRIPAAVGAPPVQAHVAHPVPPLTSAGVLVLHGCDGYGPRYVAIADWLASNGYVAVAIETPAPQGMRTSCSDRSGSRWGAHDARAPLAWIRAQPFIDPLRIAVLGYSMGAIAALDLVDATHAAASPELRAAVLFYPNCANRDAADIRAPIRILDGDADDLTPAPPCIALTQAAAAAGKTALITTYPGATHAFDVDAPEHTFRGHIVRYDAAASTAARAATLEFLARYLAR